MYIFPDIQIWGLGAFHHKLKHSISKIAQWDSYWNCEKGHFLDWLQIHSGQFILAFSESSRSELQNATNQKSLSFLVQKLLNLENLQI